MIITPNELPTNGLDKKSESINVTGLGFQDMMEYTNEYQSAQTEFKKYLIDYQWIKKKVSNWKSINLADLDAVILRWKIESVTNTNEFSVEKTCPICGTRQTLNLEVQQLKHFIPIDYYLFGEVVLGRSKYEYRCPTLEEFDEVVKRVGRFSNCKSIELLKLIATFPEFKNHPNKIEKLVLDARHQDIQVLKLLSNIYYKSEITVATKCINCKGGDWSMGVFSLIDNPFLSLVLSTGSIEDKISIEQVRRDRQS